MNKRLKEFIICPACEKTKKTKFVLAERLNGGVVGIKRFNSKNDESHYTLIIGKDFKLVCGQCGTVVYIKQKHT